MTNINDLSQTIIAVENEKDGWRLIGESNPLVATDDGFSFYLNSTPNVSLTRVEYTIHKTVGNRLKRLGAVSIESTYLPKDAFANGLTVLYRASDFDDEDTVSVTYTLSDKKTGKVISSGSIASLTERLNWERTLFFRRLLQLFQTKGKMGIITHTQALNSVLI